VVSGGWPEGEGGRVVVTRCVFPQAVRSHNEPDGHLQLQTGP